MNNDIWLEVIARIGEPEPLLLDEVTDDLPPAPEGWAGGDVPPSPRLWSRDPDGPARIGVRVDDNLPDPARVAMRLAAAAIERGVEPVILTSLPRSGFERFGLRVERYIAGAAGDRARWEAEMSAYWDLALIVDAVDLAAFG
ncbi:hypothetical protein LV82_00207 [Albidovulum inexpectatum]|uniref:Uncharacterized protein n=1 Tax=Albidovulum inexpectatum TaxID=196587 RepID=A0A2S5JLF5_9RHOB|nr:hypothetical protein [Albidovulum inexpectatum]PPB82280.1 hypothetical protein LV82_00207 [Albidovulum inexpectatum]